jgi:ABC-type glycerol-3-phosphate transport system substrate-binding protein
MSFQAGRRLAAILGAAAVVIAACSSAATPVPTVAPTPAASGAASAAPSGSAASTLPPGTKTFTYAQTTPGFSNVPTLAALDALKSQGYTIDVVELADADLIIQGVTKGQFQFGRGGTPEVAIQNGAKVINVGSLAGNEWTVYA